MKDFSIYINGKYEEPVCDGSDATEASVAKWYATDHNLDPSTVTAVASY